MRAVGAEKRYSLDNFVREFSLIVAPSTAITDTIYCLD